MEWNKVTRFSQLVAVVLFLAVFGWGYWLGLVKGRDEMAPAPADAAVQTPGAY